MKNASRMARYMMMRNGSGNRENGDMRRYYRPDMRMGEYERENEVRNGYGAYGNEGGNYARDNYGVDNRFRDRRGREHYDNGRYAPMRNEYGNMGGDYSGGYSRGNGTGREYGEENRGGREGKMRRGGVRSEMPGGWDEEEGEHMNMIGFERPQEVQTHYPTRIDYMPRNEMERGSSPKMTGGAMGAMGMEFTPEIAKEWTQKLRNEDGTKGEHWSMEQVKKLMTQRGIEYNTAEVYAIMNVLYSDYCKVFKKYGFNSPEAYLDLAIAWLNDTDAVDDKAMMYYECIVKH
jgi:hypothetical protein